MIDKKCTLCDAVRMFKKEGLDDATALAKAVKHFYGEKDDAKHADIKGETRRDT